LGWLYKRVFSISPQETTFARRGFREIEPEVRQRLEGIGEIFLHGYHAALEGGECGALVLRLNAVEAEFRGFAFEGAAMGLALLDYLMPWRRDRLSAFLEGPGAAHVYMVHVGVGWVLGRLGLRVERLLARLDPLLRWLAIDGYGFHEGYFRWRRCVGGREVPARLSGYARRAFDQGLGRSLWFVEGADASRIAATIAAFPPSRQADLWSGIGLASTYAGGVERPTLEVLRAAAGSHRGALAQGAAFAAQARQRAGNPAPHTEAACRVYCALSADEAARVTDDALSELPSDGTVPAFEVWRGRIRERFAEA
ncbi:MAG: DUF1702 family protein, partial [Planctomycetaceae bacterium]|nr:DUF1702 family protein [Planctomycetaceae bacterium]